MHINFWKCQNKLDDDGEILGIVSSENNATLGIDYEPGEKCATDEEIEEHLDKYGFVQLNYLG